MNDCPTEVWTRIFSFACTDGGKTGRSLAHVNKYVGQVAKDVRLQTVEIKGLKQLRRFLRMLEKTPANAKRVRHLFISTYEEEPVELCPPPVRMFEFLYGYGSAQPHYKEYEESRDVHHPDTVSSSLLRLLALLAPSLHTLHLAALSRDHILLPLSLPHLTDLAIHGPFPSWSVDDLSVLPFPHLLRLSLSGFCEYPMTLFPCISRLAPELRELHLSPDKPSRVLQSDLQSALSAVNHRDADRKDKLPSTLMNVVLHPGEEPSEDKYWLIPVHRDMVMAMEEMSRHDRRVLVSKKFLCTADDLCGWENFLTRSV